MCESANAWFPANSDSPGLWTIVNHSCNFFYMTEGVSAAGAPPTEDEVLAAHERVRLVFGYIVWTLTGVVIAVPEIWAAVVGESGVWPTISGTVGYLEYWHDWVALIVVAVLVWAAFHAVRYRRAGKPGHITSAGRFTLRSGDSQRLRIDLTVAYYLLALASVIAFPLWVSSARPDDKYLLGETLYGLIAIFGVIVPAVVALFFKRDVPFATLFKTVQHLESKAREVALLFVAGIAILLVHLAFYPWPSVIRDLQNLHKQQPTQAQVKQGEPDPYSP